MKMVVFVQMQLMAQRGLNPTWVPYMRTDQRKGHQMMLEILTLYVRLSPCCDYSGAWLLRMQAGVLALVLALKRPDSMV